MSDLNEFDPAAGENEDNIKYSPNAEAAENTDNAANNGSEGITENSCDDANSEGATSAETAVNNETVENKPQTLELTPDCYRDQLNRAQRKGITKGVLFTLLIFVILAVASAGIWLFVTIRNGSFYSKWMSFGGGSVLNSQSLDKMDTLYGLINSTYIEDVDKETLQDGIYKGMLESLEDPYSVYYTAEEYADMMEASSGEFEGIGAYLVQDPDTMAVSVVRPIKNSPAEAVGLLTGDIFVEIDGEDVTGQDINLIVSKVKGPAGTTVNIGVYREGEPDYLYFDIERAHIISESVESEMLENQIGYIIISEFADATGDQFIEAYDELESQGMTSLIIDLRSNGGGYVDTAVQVADRLIKEGEIVSIKDKYQNGYSYKDSGDENFSTLPMVVIADANTASASEILTGALQDYGIATVIGTQTFGKGIVQDVIPLGDGTGVKITSSKYYTPNGENIHGIGITPDIVVEWDYESYEKDGTDNQLEAAKTFLTTGTCEEYYREDS